MSLLAHLPLFPLRCPLPRCGLYASFGDVSPQLCVPAAVVGIEAALERLQRGVPPRPLDYRLDEIFSLIRRP